MKRSRLNMFKATSMTISLLGIIFLIVMVGLIAYLVVWNVNDKVSHNMGNGQGYDQLSALKSSYASLSAQFDTIKKRISSSGSKKAKKDMYNTQIELVKTNSAISDVESALASNLSSDEIDNRIKIATDQLKVAQNSVTKLATEA
ncbi:MAG TPA: hypothetical protein VK426_01330 [Methanobacterium sp.]|nr:hypothetical protein [Methanobacterium sp.]